jgi:putative ABC transport system permease protein
MVLFDLASKSLRNRKLATGLTVASIALSVALLIGVEHVRVGARESFSNTISQTDLLVGARSGAIQLLLYAVFRLGSPTNNVTFESYEKIKNHPAVKWTIPISLGDSHRGYRVVGTDGTFYREYRYRQDRSIDFAEGRAPEGIFDVALGSEVAQQLGYRIGNRIVISHGITSARGIMDHEDKPFQVAGILKRTATPVDRSLYVTLEGIEAMHIDWREGAPPVPGEAIRPEAIRKEEIRVHQITAFLLATKSRIETLALQREINNFREEGLMAIIPGVTLSELWRTIGYAEDALKAVSAFVVLVGLLGMLVSLYTSLNERRREMAILRAVGAGPGKIVGLFVLEAGLLSITGSLLGVGLLYLLVVALRSLVEQQFGFYLPLRPLSATEYVYVTAVVGCGLGIGLVPAVRAYRTALADGLSVRL